MSLSSNISTTAPAICTPCGASNSAANEHRRQGGPMSIAAPASRRVERVVTYYVMAQPRTARSWPLSRTPSRGVIHAQPSARRRARSLGVLGMIDARSIVDRDESGSSGSSILETDQEQNPSAERDSRRHFNSSGSGIFKTVRWPITDETVKLPANRFRRSAAHQTGSAFRPPERPGEVPRPATMSWDADSNRR